MDRYVAEMTGGAGMQVISALYLASLVVVCRL